MSRKITWNMPLKESEKKFGDYQYRRVVDARNHNIMYMGGGGSKEDAERDFLLLCFVPGKRLPNQPK